VLSLKLCCENAILRFIAVAIMIVVAAISITQSNGSNGYSEAEYNTSGRAAEPKQPESFWQKTETDPVAAFTGTLAIFTFALVVISAVQIYYLNRSDKTARLTAEAALKAAEASQLQARASVAAGVSELALVRICLVPFPDAPAGHQDPIIPPGPLRQNECRVIIHCANIGRTRLRTRDFCVEWLVVPRTDKTRNPDLPLPPATYTKLPLAI
jgi:hypothetical protein